MHDDGHSVVEVRGSLSTVDERVERLRQGLLALEVRRGRDLHDLEIIGIVHAYRADRDLAWRQREPGVDLVLERVVVVADLDLG